LEQPEIAAALAIARRRHEAIAGGDFEMYAAEDAALGQACATVVTLGAQALGSEDIPQLDELIALETQSRRLLEAMMNEASTSLASLRKSRTANGAYAANERLSVNGV
jgi:hypothetical protein